MGCGGCRSKKKCPKKKKRLPSINPFFHFLKCVWRKFRGCKRSVVVRYAVKKWRRMSKNEKQPFFDAACRAQEIAKAAKKRECKQPNQCKRKKKKKKRLSCPKC